jgi:hypothetical protein
MQCACAIMSSVVCLSLKTFSTFLSNGSMFGKVNKTKHGIRILLFSTNFVRNIFNSNKNWTRYEYVVLHVNYPLFLSGFNATWIFTRDFWKILVSNFMKLRSRGSALFHEGRRTDGRMDRHDEGKGHISQFCHIAWKGVCLHTTRTLIQ